MGLGDRHINEDGRPLCGETRETPIRRSSDCPECQEAANKRRKPARSVALPERASWLLTDDGKVPESVDLSVILGTVGRPDLVKQCIAAVRDSLRDSRLNYEIVVAVGEETDPALAWLCEQDDVVTVLGGMTGAIDAFNRAYEISQGLLVGQINDDVLVEGRSLTIACRHLLDHPDVDGVVFKFRRRLEVGYRNEYMGAALHPNQIVARRSTCEKVVQKIGAFWGDSRHRTDKTYGGDSAFGVVCHHLGLKLVALDDVICYDLEHADALREKNQPRDTHLRDWHQMYDPMLASRAAPRAPDTQRQARLVTLDPVEGQFPARCEPRRERVLHLHLSTPDDPQAGLVRALRGLGDYAQIDWPARNRDIAGALLEAANWLRPTLVFMQLQTNGVVDPGLVARLRPLLAPDGVIATWCGDVAAANSPWTVGWQVPLGQAVDVTLHTSLTHVKALRAAGVTAGYLQIGYDEEQYRPADVTRADGVVFLGNRYYSPQYLATMQEHDAGLRDDVIQAMSARLGASFRLYGSGHGGNIAPIPLCDSHRAYQHAKIGLNVSLCNFFEAYSSDRIFRILGCGALLLAKRFPLMSSYGLVDGVNCLIWDSPEEAANLAHLYLNGTVAERESKAAAGVALALERHTWSSRMRELAAILKAVRG